MRLTLMLALLAVLAAGQKTNPGEVQLAGAIKKEVVDGDLKGAIEQYKKIIAANRANHALAAKALVQMGQCYEKLGDAEARKAYDQVLKDYADQKELAETARGRLAALGGGQSRERSPDVVWAGPKADVSGSLSADGRYMAYIDRDTYNVALHDFVSGADRLLTNTGSSKPGEKGSAGSPMISRDGKRVAYSRYGDEADKCQLRVIEVDGANGPRCVLEGVGFDWIRSSDWSPDGKWIARVHGPNPGRLGLDLVAVQDGSVRALKTTGNPRYIRFSSDGKYLLYTSSATTPDGVERGYMMPLDGKPEAPLVSGPSSVEYPVWTPDGARVVFVSDRGGSRGLWSVRVADGKPAGEPEQLKARFTAPRLIGFANDGSLFYGEYNSSSDIYVAGLNPVTGTLTSAPRRVNEVAVGRSWGKLAWLPDGKSLSFWSQFESREAVVVHTLETGKEREVLVHPIGGTPGYYGWFPDGSLLTFDMPVRNQDLLEAGSRGGPAWTLNGQSRVFRKLDTRTRDTLATWTIPVWNNGDSANAFAPDLMTMFFTKQDEAASCQAGKCSWAMLARDMQTGRDREVSRLEGVSWLDSPSISADGRDVAFIASRADAGGGYSLMVAPTTGGAPHELHRGVEMNLSETAWTRDGSHVLAVCTGDRGAKEICSFPAKGGAPTKIPLSVQFTMVRWLTVNPDGSQIAFNGRQQKEEVSVMIPSLAR